jgi:hypothetical protein
MASRPVSLGIKPHLRPNTMIFLLSDSCGFVDVGRPLWREDGPIIFAIQPLAGPNRKHRFQQFSNVASRVRCRGNVVIGRSLTMAFSSVFTIPVFQLPCHNVYVCIYFWFFTYGATRTANPILRDLIVLLVLSGNKNLLNSSLSFHLQSSVCLSVCLFVARHPQTALFPQSETCLTPTRNKSRFKCMSFVVSNEISS